ncbi:MAG: hypothetical protein MUF29_03090, partial [Chitinophagaceae bacterium]|nr:hypothetical protein [Chitinophagaceae bacterium]
MKNKLSLLMAILVIASMVLSACGGGTTTEAGGRNMKKALRMEGFPICCQKTEPKNYSRRKVMA